MLDVRIPRESRRFCEASTFASTRSYLGRDVIATKHGVGCIRIVDQVKKYKPGHLVTAEEVRALLGVVVADPKASKGVITTTSDFAPGVQDDALLRPFMPFRLELKSGPALMRWLERLANHA